MPEMHPRQSGFTYTAFEPLQKVKKEYRSLNKTQDIFTKMN